MMALFFSVGISVGLIFYEITGITPGGIIVPGYLALFAQQPLRILATLGTAFVAFGIGKLLFRFIIAYGRRRFALLLLIGIAVRVLMDWVVFDLLHTSLGLHTIGLLIPGIIASDMERQGVGVTLLALGIVSAFLYILTLLIPQSWLV